MNFGTPVPLLIGIILILGAMALFFLDKFRPGYERDSDKVYAVLLLISGIFLLAHLDMDLIPSFQQLLMAGMLTALLIENIRSRLPRTDPLVPPYTNRPPSRPPRYDERPPVRRGYKAELDNRGVPVPAGVAFNGEGRSRPPRMSPAPDPRMAPAQNEYWRGEYDARPRQPYEEYRGPAGRLQPSPVRAQPSDRPQPRQSDRPQPDRFEGDRPQGANRDTRDDRYADNNGRYGERPPANPPVSYSDERMPERRPDRAPDRNQNGAPENSQQRPDPRPEQQRPEQSRSNGSSGGRPQNGDRALNVRPYSEAPKLDLNRPEGMPSES